MSLTLEIKKLIENMNKHLGLYLTIMATKYHNTENFKPKVQNIYIQESKSLPTFYKSFLPEGSMRWLSG